MDRKAHGEARSGMITASVASTIMSGGEKAWETLIRNLWADDGTAFADSSVGGARAAGLENECVGRSMYWERHPRFEVDDPKFVHFARRGFRKNHPYYRLLACSPDFGVLVDGKRKGGGEVKSPVSMGVYNVYNAYVSRGKIPPEHVDQVFYSLWVTGWNAWAFVTHFEHLYAEAVVGKADPAFLAWVERFRPRLDAFIAAYMDGEQPVRDKLSVSSLASLLRS